MNRLWIARVALINLVVLFCASMPLSAKTETGIQDFCDARRVEDWIVKRRFYRRNALRNSTSLRRDQAHGSEAASPFRLQAFICFLLMSTQVWDYFMK